MSEVKKSHDLHDFMIQISQDMASEYTRIRKRATEDPGTAGDQGEENWATLLKDWLPSTYQIVTKGRIISHDGRTSPQIDVLVLKESYPKKLLDKKVYLAAGVAAAFECKVTLKASHIEEAISNCVAIKELFPARKGSPYKELHSPIVYGLLAHSHSWKGEQSTPVENIKNKLHEEDNRFVTHPNKMLDLLCVADLGTWASKKMTFVGPKQIADWSKMAPSYGHNGSATTAFVGYTHQGQNQKQDHYFTPIGTLISNLSQKLAWENDGYRSLADYYRITALSGSGSGEMRMWSSEIYSDEIRLKVENGMLVNGEAWAEWSCAF
ncbi:TPA: DUF6602 domain-containing protein [Vibrio metoecus]